MTVCPGKPLGLGTLWQIYVETSSDSIWHNCTASAHKLQHFHFSTNSFKRTERFKQRYGWPEHKSWICSLLFSHVDKTGYSWSYSMQDILSVMSRDTKCSHAKQPGHVQVAQRYFIFISFPKKVQALLYAYREGQNKAFRFYIVQPLKIFTGTKQKTVLRWFVYLFGVKGFSAFDRYFTVKRDRKTGEWQRWHTFKIQNITITW